LHAIEPCEDGSRPAQTGDGAPPGPMRQWNDGVLGSGVVDDQLGILQREVWGWLGRPDRCVLMTGATCRPSFDELRMRLCHEAWMGVFDLPRSDCVLRQFIFHSFWSRTMALSMTMIFRMHAVIATSALLRVRCVDYSGRKCGAPWLDAHRCRPRRDSRKCVLSADLWTLFRQKIHRSVHI